MALTRKYKRGSRIKSGMMMRMGAPAPMRIAICTKRADVRQSHAANQGQALRTLPTAPWWEWKTEDLGVVLVGEVTGRGVRTPGLAEVRAETGDADVEEKLLYVRRHGVVASVVECRETVEELEGPMSAASDRVRRAAVRCKRRTTSGVATDGVTQETDGSRSPTTPQRPPVTS